MNERKNCQQLLEIWAEEDMVCIGSKDSWWELTVREADAFDDKLCDAVQKILKEKTGDDDD